jgi:hypothetical protein
MFRPFPADTIRESHHGVAEANFSGIAKGITSVRHWQDQ